MCENPFNSVQRRAVPGPAGGDERGVALEGGLDVGALEGMFNNGHTRNHPMFLRQGSHQLHVLAGFFVREGAEQKGPVNATLHKETAERHNVGRHEWPERLEGGG